jgi:hypothetical protein
LISPRLALAVHLLSIFLTNLIFSAAIAQAAIAQSASIGVVERQTGAAELTRSGQKMTIEQNGEVEMKDLIKTANGVMDIGFNDATRVQIGKHSNLLIDDFIYDGKKRDPGRLSLKVALGTVKYASGLIAKHNHESVKIRTPTARIGVLGTSFSMTVNELGSSLIILLPNSDGSVGAITVESDVGQVLLDQAYQATTVETAEQVPTPPTILDLSASEINNLLIVKQLPLEKNQDESSGKIDFIDSGLDINMLDNNALDEPQLEFHSLDVNLLDTDLLINLLDSEISEISEISENLDSGSTEAIRAGQFEGGNTQIVIDDNISVHRNIDGRLSQINVGQFSDTIIILNQGGSSATLNTQKNASDSVIIINQN